MKCQKCKKNNADTHVKRVINGEFEEYHLCSECAKEMGYTNVFSNFAESFSDDFNSLFGSFFENALPARTQATRCETCGTTYNDIARTGMMGCADCYNIFSDKILPTIRRVHGNTTHCGKNSPSYKAEKTEEKSVENKTSELDDLKAELENAIKNQEFEKAAVLRDRIKEKEDNNE
ncbi:MAG: UvrB/UvrC motif-containing protein [Ruminococcus sp.]|nr:UvrB/UvrC motif-containing protein [Ruminococcus sp.]